MPGGIERILDDPNNSCAGDYTPGDNQKQIKVMGSCSGRSRGGAQRTRLCRQKYQKKFCSPNNSIHDQSWEHDDFSAKNRGTVRSLKFGCPPYMMYKQVWICHWVVQDLFGRYQKCEVFYSIFFLIYLGFLPRIFTLIAWVTFRRLVVEAQGGGGGGLGVGEC